MADEQGLKDDDSHSGCNAESKVDLKKIGPYHMFLYFIVSTASAYCAFPLFAHVFLTENSLYRCFVPGCDNVTKPLYNQKWLQEAIPQKKDLLTGKRRLDKCLMFIRNANVSSSGVVLCNNATFDKHKKESCDKWVFEDDHVTLDRKWGLLCGKQWLWDTAESVYMAGMLFGASLVGVITDRFGRKRSYLCFASLLTISCIAVIYSPNFNFYIAANFFIGISAMLSAPLYTLFLENVHAKSRTIFGMSLGIWYAVAELLLALTAYSVPDWNSRMMIIYFPSCFFFFLFFFTPESIAWLIDSKRFDEAKKEIARLGRWNKIKIPENLFDDQTEVQIEADGPRYESYHSNKKLNLNLKFKKSDSKVNGNPLMLFVYPNLRKRTIALMVIWFCDSIIYFGTSLGSKDIGYNYIVTFSLLASVEIPAVIIGTIAVMVWGRKRIQFLLFMIAGCACLSYIFIPDEYLSVGTGLAVLGKGCIASQWAISIIFTAEQFPTVLRTVGYSTCSIFARVAAIIVSYIPDLICRK